MRYALGVAAWGALCAFASGAGAQAASADSASGPYARYTNPAACAQAAIRFDLLAWLPPQYPDTVRETLFATRMPQPAIDAARQCVQRFRIQTAKDADLFGLARAYVAADMIPLADSAFRRLLALRASRPVTERAWTIVQILDVYLAAKPVRLREALQWGRALDALGREAAGERLVGHMAVASLAMRVDSVTIAESAAVAAVRASTLLRGARREIYGNQTIMAAEQLADVRARRGDPEGAGAALQALIPMMKDLLPRIETGIPQTIAFYRNQGKPAPTPRVTRWYGDSTHRGGVGRPSLVVFVVPFCETCDGGYAVIRRLQQADPDLDVIFLTSTRGYAPTGVLTPDQEFEAIRKHFLEDLRFRVALGIWQTPFRRRTGDGGLQPTSRDPNHEAYLGRGADMMGFLVDARGTLRWWNSIAQWTEQRWQNVIAETRAVGEMPAKVSSVVVPAP